MLLAGLNTPATAVGFQRIEIVDDGYADIDVGVWYPSKAPVPTEANTPWGQALALGDPIAGSALPLVVISHGNGGWMGGHAGLAYTLAEAGFVVAAPEHPGDGGASDDGTEAPASRWLPERPRDLSRTLDHMTGRWSGAAHLDPARVGAFGFSAGAYGALALTSARFDPAQLVAYCDAHPEEWACELGIGADVAAAIAAGTLDPAGFERFEDNRVDAVVLAGPALGFGFDPASLAEMMLPLQIWSGELDTAVPVATNTAFLLQHLPPGVDSRVVPNAGHFGFLAACRASLERDRPDLWERVCVDAAGFDRAAFQQDLNASVTRFFIDALAPTPVIGVRSLSADAPHRRGPLDVTLWYPARPGGVRELLGDNGVFTGTAAQRDAPVLPGGYPLVLLSHGGGGNARQFGWIANRLVGAGYLVAAPDHPGSTTGNASPLDAVKLWQRPADLSAVLTSLLDGASAGLEVDPDRIGALGFSAGGYTVLATVGARIDPEALARFCDGEETGMSDCAFLARGGVDLHAIDLSPAAQDLRDPRIRTAVAVDPGVVGTLSAASLAAIDAPVTLLNLGAPGAIPKGVLAEETSRRIPDAHYETVDDAVHFSFLPECKPAGPAILAEEGEPDALCDDAGGRARAALHEAFGDVVVQAFERDLDQ